MNVDHVLGAAGLGLAFAAAALPWHVWSNPQAYERPRIAFERLNDDPAIAAFAPRPERLVTASVTRPAGPAVEHRKPRIVFATATHALARLPGAPDVTLLKPGSRLGGGDAVERIEMRAGRWTIVTTKGRALAVTR